jgi:hypothetical protein
MRRMKFLCAGGVFCFSMLAAVTASADSTQSWLMSASNTSSVPCSSASPCASVSLDISSTGKTATFTVTSLNNGYVFDTFGFNAETGAAGSHGSGSLLNLSLLSSSGEVSSPSLDGLRNEDGWGKFDYNFNTGKNGGSNASDCSVSGGTASAGCTFSFTLSGTGLTLADFELASVNKNGGSGSDLFAGHEANGSGFTGYVGSETPAPVPEPSMLSMLFSGFIAAGTFGRRFLRS